MLARWQDLPSNLREIMRTFGVRPEGTTLEEWYVTDQERIQAIGRAEAQRMFGGPPSTWTPSPTITPTVTPTPTLSNNGGGKLAGPYETEWDIRDIKQAALGKNGFLGPSDFWSLADWGMYASAVKEHTRYVWSGTEYVIPGDGNGSDSGIGDLLPLALVAAVALFMG